MSLNNTPNAISSPGSPDGPLPCSLRDGLQTDLFGLEAARASRFLLPDDKKVKKMIATYGPSGNVSSASAALQASMESKLRQQLPMGGLTMFIKGWRRMTTPSGRLYCQLVASDRPISGTDFGLWATPKCQNANTPGKHGRGGLGLQDQIALWPKSARTGNRGTISCRRQVLGVQDNGSIARTERKGSLNPAFPCWLMGFSSDVLSSMVSAMQSYRTSRRNSSRQRHKGESK